MVIGKLLFHSLDKSADGCCDGLVTLLHKHGPTVRFFAQRSLGSTVQGPQSSPWFNGPGSTVQSLVQRSRVHGPESAMAEETLDLNAAAAALAEAVEAAVAGVDAAETTEQPGEVVPQGSAEIANQVIQQGIQISPAVIGLTSERIVEHYGCLGIL